jgi:hypothetical protein
LPDTLLPSGRIALRTVILPYGVAKRPLVMFALTHKMYGPTIAEPQYMVFGPRMVGAGHLLLDCERGT